MMELGLVTLVVRGYDEAIDFYVDTLGFTLVEDTPLSAAKRWVVVATSATSRTRLLLALAATPEQIERVGDQTGGACSCSSIPTTSRPTTPGSSLPVFVSSKNPAARPTAWWPSSKTSTATAGTSPNHSPEPAF